MGGVEGLAGDGNLGPCDIQYREVIGIAAMPGRGGTAAVDLQGLSRAFAGHERLDQKAVQMSRQDDMRAAVGPCLQRAGGTVHEFLFHLGVLMEGMMGDDYGQAAIVLSDGGTDAVNLVLGDAAALHAQGIGRVDSDQRGGVGLDERLGLGRDMAPVGGAGPEQTGRDVIERDVVIAGHRYPRCLQLIDEGPCGAEMRRPGALDEITGDDHVIGLRGVDRRQQMGQKNLSFAPEMKVGDQGQSGHASGVSLVVSVTGTITVRSSCRILK